MRNGSLEHPGYKNRNPVKSKGGYQNIRLVDGNYRLIIGAIDYGIVDMSTPDAVSKTLARRDSSRAKQLLPPASY
jgi:hypothetical protein